MNGRVASVTTGEIDPEQTSNNVRSPRCLPRLLQDFEQGKVLNGDVLTLAITDLLESSPKCGQPSGEALWRSGTQIPDHRHRLLRARRDPGTRLPRFRAA
jgi:hypothetical protein